MKTKHFLFAVTVGFLIAGKAIAQTTNPSPYCAANYDDANGFPVPHYISKVILGTLTNNSGTTQAAGGHYIYYNNLTAPAITKGTNYSLSVTHDGGGTIHFVAVYIDLNHDNDFADAGERIIQKTINDANAIPNPVTATINIPVNNSYTGTTRMRVVVFEDDEYTWNAANLNATPCTSDATGFLDWGETEDYNITITGTTGISETALSNEIQIFPNPSNGDFSIQTDDSIESIEIYNLLGQNVYSDVTVSNNKYYLDLDVPDGLYLVQIKTDKGFLYSKIAIKK